MENYKHTHLTRKLLLHYRSPLHGLPLHGSVPAHPRFLLAPLARK